jgi:AAA+ ATPase superfamily predicted ATPase
MQGVLEGHSVTEETGMNTEEIRKYFESLSNSSLLEETVEASATYGHMQDKDSATAATISLEVLKDRLRREGFFNE